MDLVEVYTDEDEDYSSPDEGSDSEPILEDGGTRRPLHHLRGAARSKSLPPNARVSFLFPHMFPEFYIILCLHNPLAKGMS